MNTPTFRKACFNLFTFIAAAHKIEQSNLVFTELNEKYGPIVKLRNGKKWSIFLFDPDYVEQAFWYEGKFPERISMPLLETYCRRKKRRPGLSLMQGDQWNKVRKAVQNQTSKPAVVSRYLPLHLEVADDFVQCIAQEVYSGTPMENLIMEYTVESTAHYCFNSRFGFLDRSEKEAYEKNQTFLKNVQNFLSLIAYSFYTFPMFKYYPTQLYKEFETAADLIYGVAERDVEREYLKLKKCPLSNHDQPNLLQALLQDRSLEKETVLSLTGGFFAVATENVG
ncbi:hypothetical protein SNE40_019830 [Patella caerulea]|uniref:Cytochrome P450 n=1 Tax=Patella caerulea TaxID=87958 RepID=A0AAN8G2N7_PATCE